MLDVGCGSGILAIAAAKLGAQRVVCLDVDADAVGSARRNIEVAGVAGTVEVELGSLPDVLAPAGGFDVVVANISANVLIDLAAPLLECLAPAGVAIGSGVMTERQQEVIDAFSEAGAEVREVVTAGDWVALVVQPGAATRAHGTGG